MVLAFLGYSGLSFVALALVAGVVVRIVLTRQSSVERTVGVAEPITYDI